MGIESGLEKLDGMGLGMREDWAWRWGWMWEEDDIRVGEETGSMGLRCVW